MFTKHWSCFSAALTADRGEEDAHRLTASAVACFATNVVDHQLHLQKAPMQLLFNNSVSSSSVAVSCILAKYASTLLRCLGDAFGPGSMASPLSQ